MKDAKRRSMYTIAVGEQLFYLGWVKLSNVANLEEIQYLPLDLIPSLSTAFFSNSNKACEGGGGVKLTTL